MNPFRRIWPREFGLYLTALALLAQALMGVAHTAHAFAPAEAAICAVEHEQAPAHTPPNACPLCQIPSFAGPLPPAVEVATPIAWTALVFAANAAAIGAAPYALPPPARGPPASV